MQQSNSVGERGGGGGDLGGRVLVSLPFVDVCFVVYSPSVLLLSCPLKYIYPGDSRGTGYSCIKVRGRTRGIWVKGRRRGVQSLECRSTEIGECRGKIKWLVVDSFDFRSCRQSAQPISTTPLGSNLSRRLRWQSLRDS